MYLTHENYFSLEASREYISVSQFKDFTGTSGIKPCEAMAMAKIDGLWANETSQAMLVGSYVDAHFSGILDVFAAKHPEIYRKDGNVKSIFQQANEIINRVEQDSYFMKFMDGKKQRIFTGELYNAKWKCMVDVINEDVGFITDLKVVRSIYKKIYSKESGYLNFIDFWGYNIQAAIYQEIVRQNIGKTYPFFIAAASKEKYTDFEIITFKQCELDEIIESIEPSVNKIIKIKEGKQDSVRCDNCDYCTHTKVLSKPIYYTEI